MEIGVYKIVCEPTGEIYVGSSRNIKNRFWTHGAILKAGTHENKLIQARFNTYGHKALTYHILQECSVDELKDVEQFYIDSLKPELNIRRFAYSNKGIVLSEEARLRISIGNRGNTKRRGKKVSDESRLRMSAAQKGRPSSKKLKGVVLKMDRQMNVIKEYSSMDECLKHEPIKRTTLYNQLKYPNRMPYSQQEFVYKFKVLSESKTLELISIN